MSRRAGLLAFAIVWIVAAHSPRATGDTSAHVPPPSTSRADAAGLERRIGARAPLAARFRTSDGAEVTLGDVLQTGKPTLLVLAYNRCSMLCSLVLRRVAELVPQLAVRPDQHYTLLTVSIDPSETVHEAARLQAALLERAGLAGERHRWQFLTGEKPEIDLLASAVGFRYAWDPETAQYNHPAVLMTLAPGGVVSGYFDGLQPDPSALEAALERPGPTMAAATIEDVILNCFRFDTARSRYGSTIAWLLRLGAAGLIMIVGALVWRVSRAHRRTGVQP